eukprot:3771285-Amphidinium_carterae.1
MTIAQQLMMPANGWECRPGSPRESVIADAHERDAGNLKVPSVVPDYRTTRAQSVPQVLVHWKLLDRMRSVRSVHELRCLRVLDGRRTKGLCGHA